MRTIAVPMTRESYDSWDAMPRPVAGAKPRCITCPEAGPGLWLVAYVEHRVQYPVVCGVAGTIKIGLVPYESPMTPARRLRERDMWRMMFDAYVMSRANNNDSAL